MFVMIMALQLQAQSATDVVLPSARHEVRVGWGDMMFETVAFHDSPSHNWANTDVISDKYLTTDLVDHRYTGHIFADYHYNVLKWLAVGGQIDFEGIFWKEVTYGKNHIQVGEAKDVKNYNVVLMPTVRFTYFHSQWVNLYSGLGIGLNIACDNSNQREAAIAFNINLLSVSVGNEHWFGAVEFGLLNSLKNTNNIYMIGSRILSASVGYRF